jgi:hypothetical protein
LTGAARDIASNYQSLPPGEAIIIPQGQYLIGVGPYSFLQELDPITQSWRGMGTARMQRESVWSDGANFRVANLTGCPVAAIVVAGGSGYVAGATSVTASAGGSTWNVLVGGMVSLSTINNAGTGYGLAPNLLIAAPPAGGVQATGYCTLTGSSVTGVTITNVGAGYTTAPRAVVVPSQFDPNLTTTAITPATVTFVLVGSGSISAVVCTNNGAAQSSAPTLTVGGAGTSGSVVAVMCNTISSGSVVTGGTGYSGGAITTFGGVPSATPQWTNPAIQLTAAIPRQAQIGLFATGGSLISVSTIYDGGLFFGTPTAVALGNGLAAVSSLASVQVTLGSATDTVFIQPR